jgi:hypothetical protein
MSTIKDIINARIKAAKNQAPKLNITYAKTVGIDSDSSPAVANRPGFVWVQEKGNNHAFQVYNPSVKLAVNMPVKIVRDTNVPSRRIVQGVDWDSLAVQLTSSNPGQALGVANHHRDHEWPNMFPGLDPVHTYPRALVPLKIYPGTTALTISVAPGYYMVDNTTIYFVGLIDHDISSFVPATPGNHVSVLVFIDSATNLVGYLSGSESALLFPVEPAIPDGDIGLGYIRLVHGMSGLLTETDITNDPRPFISIATGGAGGTPATTVTDETTWGITPAVGSDTEYARQDHTHGSPAAPSGSGDVIQDGAVTIGHLTIWSADHHVEDGGAPGSGGSPGFQTLSYVSPIVWDLSSGSAEVTLAGDVELSNPSNMVNGEHYFLKVIQDVTGAHLLTYDTVYKFPNGIKPILSTLANFIDLLSFECDGSSMFFTGLSKNMIDQFLPTSISGILMWLAANLITGKSNNDPISSWLDSSANSNDATQSTAGYKPLYKTSVVNGLPTVYFDNTDDSLLTPLNLADHAPFTIFIVMNYADVSLSVGYHRAIQGQTNNFLIGPWSGNWSSYLNGTIAGPVIVDNNFVCLTYLANGPTGDHTLRVNGSDVGAIGQPSYGPGIIVLGVGAYNEPVFGNIAEILIYDSALSNANRDLIEAYLVAKYNL